MNSTNDTFRQEQLDQWSLEREARQRTRAEGREVDHNGFASRHQPVADVAPESALDWWDDEIEREV